MARVKELEEKNTDLVKGLAFITCFLFSTALFGQSIDRNNVPFCIFNRSYNKEDIGARIYLNGLLLFETTSINDTFDLKTNFVTDMDVGLNVVTIEDYDFSFKTTDTVEVLSPTTLHRLWIDYEHVPSPEDQFNITVKSKLERLMASEHWEPKDSARVHERLKRQIAEDQAYWIKEPVPQAFKVKWVYSIKKEEGKSDTD